MACLHHDGITFHYLDSGEGVPFLFQHGLGGDLTRSYGLLTPPLPFRLLSFDFRGHGETRPLGDSEKLSFATFADDLLAVLDERHIAQAVIGGISMGAAVALNFALRYPQRMLGLVLVRPAWLNEPLPANLQAYPRIAQLIRQHGKCQNSELENGGLTKSGEIDSTVSKEWGKWEHFVAILWLEWGKILSVTTPCPEF
jgi:pimeloyl-ACP methyl ester carboxylesterase